EAGCQGVEAAAFSAKVVVSLRCRTRPSDRRWQLPDRTASRPDSPVGLLFPSLVVVSTMKTLLGHDVSHLLEWRKRRFSISSRRILRSLMRTGIMRSITAKSPANGNPPAEQIFASSPD